MTEEEKKAAEAAEARRKATREEIKSIVREALAEAKPPERKKPEPEAEPPKRDEKGILDSLADMFGIK